MDSRFKSICQSNWFWALLIVAATTLVYLPALRGGFIWDDYDGVFLNNPQIHDSWGWLENWYHPKTPDYLPVTFDSFWFEWRLWGENPTGYHVTNLIMHLAACLMLWKLIDRLGLPGGRWVALLFAIHPVNVASVAWIAERKNVLSCDLYLASLLCFLRAEQSQRWRYFSLSLLLFAVGLLCKASIVMLPLALLGYRICKTGRIAKKDFVLVSPFLAVATVAGLITVAWQSHDATADMVRPEGPLSRFMASGWAVWFYLGKAFAPTDLAMPYPRWNVEPSVFLHYLPVCLLLLMLALAWRFRASFGKSILLASGYFVLNLLPVLGIFDAIYFKHSLVADHWQYVSIAAPIVWVVYIASRFRSQGVVQRNLVDLTGLAYVCTLAICAWSHAGSFASMEAWCRDTLAKNPDAWVAHHNLAFCLERTGASAEAEQHFRAALALYPREEDIYLSLGEHYLKLSQLPAAMDVYNEGIANCRKCERLCYNAGNGHLLLGQLPQAKQRFEQVVASNPHHAAAHDKLGYVCMVQGDAPAALDHFRKAAAADPKVANYQVNYGLALAKSGQYAEAVPVLQRAVELDPNHLMAHVNLAQVYMKQSAPELAVPLFERAVALAPNDLRIQIELTNAKTALALGSSNTRLR